MDKKIQDELMQEEPSEFLHQMLVDTRNLVNLSRRKMTEFWSTWDRNDETYRSMKCRDKEDIAAGERKEPEKMVVPISYAQISTFVTFCHTLYNQRDRLFELEGFTAEDDKPAKIGESLLARDLDHNKFGALLSQFLLDIARFGIGIFKTTWVVEQQMVKKTITKPPMSFLGVTIGSETTEEVVEWATSYEGNQIINISPYRFFPDVRLPFTRFQEGEYCASEEVYSVSQLKQWEKEGVVAGVDFIKSLGKDIAQDRGFRWDTGLDPGGALTQGAGVRGTGQTKKTVIITECQRTIIPSQYEIAGEPLGPENHPVKYVIWLANDNRVIKCEPMNYLHNEFTYSMAQYTYDNNVLVSSGLSDVIDSLQNVISWFINSRITNVRKVIGDKLVVNPAMVNMADLQNRRPVIRLSAAASGDIDRHIKQLQLVDVTASHIRDVKDLHDILKMVSGISDSLLGEVRPGKRSATENRNTTSGAANRIKVPASIIFESALAPMAKQMLSNLRDGLDEPTYVRIMGMKGQSTPEFIQVSKEDLVGHYGFEVFDGTLPSERYISAQALEEFLMPMLQNPQVAMLLGLDLKKMVFEILMLRGIKNPERFLMDPALQQQQMQLAQQQAATQNGQPNAAPAINGQPADGAPTPAGVGDTLAGVPGTLPQSLLSALTQSPSRGGGNGNGGRI